jgi:hypothetical protein
MNKQIALILAFVAIVFSTGAESASAKTYRLWNGKATVNLPAGVSVKATKYPGMSETQYDFTARGSDNSLGIWLSPLSKGESGLTMQKIMNNYVRYARQAGGRVLSNKANGKMFVIKSATEYSQFQTISQQSAYRQGNSLIFSQVDADKSEWNSSALKKLRAVAASLKLR